MLTSELIDLRLGDCEDAMIRGDLAIVDPPWLYRQSFGEGTAADHYLGLPVKTIERHLARIRAPRMAMWITHPVSATDWPASIRGWGRPVTGGCWYKTADDNTGHYGQGFHWAGCCELVSVYTRQVRAHPITTHPPAMVGLYTDRGVPLRSSHISPPGDHSFKPVSWMATWIRRWVPPGGTVVDPYCGLGSVAHAVLQAGGNRRYRGWEINPKRHAQAMALLGNWRPT